MPPAVPDDYAYLSDIAQILVREGTVEHPRWLVTWLPEDGKHPLYPGSTLSSEEHPFPTDKGPAAAAECVDRWAKADRKTGRKII